MQKWEYALVKFEKSASKVTLITQGYNLEEFEFDLMDTVAKGRGITGKVYNRPNEWITIDFLTKLGNSGWEVIEVLANDQMFLKRPVEE